jgi:hypothetical protein
MNAIAILNDRFLKKSKPTAVNNCFLVGLHMESMNLLNGQTPNTAEKSPANPFDPSSQQPSTIEHLSSSKNQIILFLYTFRKYMRWPLIALNSFFILMELLLG